MVHVAVGSLIGMAKITSGNKVLIIKGHGLMMEYAVA
jgi:hypothetical protein